MVKELWPEQPDYQPILVDDEDYEALSNYRAHYRLVSVDLNKKMKKLLGADEKLHLDHINRNPHDYRRSNLRVVTCAENLHNSGSRVGSVSKYKGVSWTKNQSTQNRSRLRWVDGREGMWQAAIYVSKRNTFLGYYELEEEAARAYDKAAIEHFGPHAYLNFPEEHLPPQANLLEDYPDAF